MAGGRKCPADVASKKGDPSDNCLGITVYDSQIKVVCFWVQLFRDYGL